VYPRGKRAEQQRRGELDRQPRRPRRAGRNGVPHDDGALHPAERKAGHRQDCHQELAHREV